jgi:hypothetical protein
MRGDEDDRMFVPGRDFMLAATRSGSRVSASSLGPVVLKVMTSPKAASSRAGRSAGRARS